MNTYSYKLPFNFKMAFKQIVMSVSEYSVLIKTWFKVIKKALTVTDY